MTHCAPNNAKIAEKIEEAELDPDQEALLEKLLGKDYEIVTADERLDRIAADFVEHCATRSQSGKALFVCIDKITCARMYQRISPRWRAKAKEIRSEAESRKQQASMETDAETVALLLAQADRRREQAAWMESTLIEIVISEAQNEVADFRRWVTMKSVTTISSRRSRNGRRR